MSPFKRILAITDLSTPSRHAVQRAAMVSRDTLATLDLLHVAHLAPLERVRKLLEPTADSFGAKVVDAAKQKLGELADTLQAHYGVQAGIQVAEGSVFAEVAQEAKRLAGGLLVCGSRGESIVRHFVLGTTALRLLSTTACPVLVVKQPPHEPYRKILIAVDFSSSSLRSIQQARSLAPDAQLILLHAYEAPFESHLRYASVDEDTIAQYQAAAKHDAQQKLHAMRSDAGVETSRCQLVLVHGNPAMRTLQYEAEVDADLIVMGKHGETLIEELLLGSVTKQVLAECQSDLLVTV